MSGPHDPDKKLVNFWATDDEKALLQAAARKAGFSNLADYLRWIAKAQPAPGELPQPTQKPTRRSAAKGS